MYGMSLRGRKLEVADGCMNRKVTRDEGNRKRRIEESKRWGGKRNRQKRVEVMLGASEQLQVCITQKTNPTYHNHPGIHIVNGSVWYIPYKTRTA